MRFNRPSEELTEELLQALMNMIAQNLESIRTIAGLIWKPC
jgi:hypothetical protein